MNIIRTLRGGALLCLLAALPSLAQPSVATSRGRPVLVVLRERFARPALGAVIQQTAGPGGRDVIAIRREDLTPEFLDALLFSLARSRTKHGENPEGRVIQRFPHGAPTRPIDTKRKEKLARTVDLLATKSPQMVPGIGRVAAVTLPALP